MTTKNTTLGTPITTTSEDFRLFLDTLAVFAESELRVNAFGMQVNEERTEIVDAIRKDYLDAKAAMVKAEEAAIAFVQLHPEWFKKAKSVSTPVGTVSKRDVTALVIENEAMTLRLIRGVMAEDAQRFIRTEESPNVEALEALTDEELTALGVKRERYVTYKVKAPAIDLGKTVGVEGEVQS